RARKNALTATRPPLLRTRVPSMSQRMIFTSLKWKGPFLRNGPGSGEWIRTTDLRVMSPTSYHCSTPRRPRSSIPRFFAGPQAFLGWFACFLIFVLFAHLGSFACFLIFVLFAHRFSRLGWYGASVLVRGVASR